MIIDSFFRENTKKKLLWKLICIKGKIFIYIHIIKVRRQLQNTQKNSPLYAIFFYSGFFSFFFSHLKSYTSYKLYSFILQFRKSGQHVRGNSGEESCSTQAWGFFRYSTPSSNKGKSKAYKKQPSGKKKFIKKKDKGKHIRKNFNCHILRLHH